VWGGAGLFVLLGLILLVVCLNSGGGGETDEIVQAPIRAPQQGSPARSVTRAPDIKPLDGPKRGAAPKPLLDLQAVDESPKEPAEGKRPRQPADGPPRLPEHTPPTAEVKDPGPQPVTEPVRVRGRKTRPALLPDLPVLTPVEFKIQHPTIVKVQGVKRALRLAVTPPQYDNMGQLLSALGTGYKYTPITEQDLRNLTRLTQFDVVFLTCAGTTSSDTRLNQALRGFVERGGTLYASDLRYDALAGAFPEYIDSGKVGGGQTGYVKADVVDPGLGDLLGDEITLHFNAGGWKPAFFRRDRVNVFLEGLPPGSGNAVYAPPRPPPLKLTPDERKYVDELRQRIDRNRAEVLKEKFRKELDDFLAVKKAKAAAEEKLSPAPPKPSRPPGMPLLVKFACRKGAVIFTSFHNAAQNSALEKKLLQYLVFTAVTVQVEGELRKSMSAAGFVPQETRRFGGTAGKTTEVQTYDHPREGPLQFAVGFEGQGVRVRFTMQTPGKKQLVHEDSKSFLVEIPSAPAGEWHFTVTALNVPFPNYPLTMTVGKAKE
jgi:hypothetical protein